jgi:site-specific DNA recombinase
VVEYVEEEGQHGEWWWDDGHGRNPTPHRPLLTDVVRGIESGEIHALIVYKQDRLVRDSGVADALNKLCREHGVRFISRGRDTEIDTARGLYQVAVDSAAARQWRDQISEDIIRDHDYKFRHQMFTRNPSCFGFRSRGKDSQAVRPVYEELRIVIRIYQMFLGIGQSALGPYQIARIFEKEGVVISTGSKGHKAANPKKVHGTSIKQILANPMYAGRWVHNGEIAFFPRLLVQPENGEGEAKTVIPEDWYQATQSKLEERPKVARSASGDDRLLSGLVVCSQCGRQMHVNSKNLKDGGKTLRWFCFHRTGTHATCHGENYATVVVEELDEWAKDCLAPYLAAEVASMEDEVRGDQADGDLRALEGKLDKLKMLETTKLKSVLDVLDPDQFAALAQELRSDRQELERKIHEVRGVLASREERAVGDLASATLETLQGALKRFVQWISVSRSGVTVLTSMGTYVGADFQERDMSLYGSTENRRRLLPPTLVSVANCPSWISSPEEFVEGRRHALGVSARRLTDEQILPGVWMDNGESDVA